MHYSLFGKPAQEGIILKGPRHIYHIGIIDWLVEYNVKKKLEASYYKTRGKGNVASCRNPTRYAERQIQFVRDEMAKARKPGSKDETTGVEASPDNGIQAGDICATVEDNSIEDEPRDVARNTF